MSKLQSPEDYEREIALVERLIRMEEWSAEQYGKDFATELSLQSLNARRTALLDEMRALGFERQRKTA
jgi:ribosomal protein S15P/S13E